MQAKYRLKSRKTYTYIYAHGKARHTDFLTLVFTPSKYSVKFGFSAGKKVGGAVVRNKVRRRLKEIVRAMIPEIKAGSNYIITAKAGAADLDFYALQKEVRTLFKKANMVKNNE